MLKTILRDAMPAKLQVPLKFFYSQARGWLEPEMALLSKLVKAEDLVIDIGGNRGIYAYALFRLGSRLAVFEPNPDCFRILYDWAARKKNVDVYGVALSSQHGQTQLHIPIDSAGYEHDASASLQFRYAGTSRPVDVEVATLDSFRFQDVKFIKIDVEGHELDVLKGAANTIISSMPVMLIEIEQRHSTNDISEIFGFISLLGYDGFYLDGNILRSIVFFDETKDQPTSGPGGKGRRYINNFLFIPRDPSRFADRASRLPYAS